MIRDCLQILVLLTLAWLVYSRTAADGPVSFDQATDQLPQAQQAFARIWAQVLEAVPTTAESRQAGLVPEITGGDIAAYLQGRPIRPVARTTAVQLKNRKSS